MLGCLDKGRRIDSNHGLSARSNVSRGGRSIVKVVCIVIKGSEEVMEVRIYSRDEFTR